MTVTAEASGTMMIGDREVRRMGFGAMRIVGDGVWGPPDDRDAMIRLVRRAVELGVNLIDTADSYGPEISEEIIAEALHPYDDDLLIATKAGFVRTGPGEWRVDGDPDRLKDAVEGSLRRLRVDTIDLLQLHRIDDDYPVEDQIGALTELQEQGKIRHLGLSEVSVEQLERCRELADIVSVQNRYNLAFRKWDDVVGACEDADIAFLPWYPVAAGKIEEDGPVTSIADDHDATPYQIALAWLLHRSRVICPIPGTSSQEHLEENVAASVISLSGAEMTRLNETA
ncbi:MAG: aldo/keto reductase [Nitriliruptorales bacterium]|nr:aldo/keto reductase [Nitriliruptorales bacterium]